MSKERELVEKLKNTIGNLRDEIDELNGSTDENPMQNCMNCKRWTIRPNSGARGGNDEGYGIREDTNRSFGCYGRS
jgi:hypothetical protein